MLAGLSYPLWPIAPLFVLKSSKRQDPYLVYHAYQGLAWGVLSTIGLGVGLLILMVLFRLMPGSSTMVPGVLGLTVFFGGWVALIAVFMVALFLGWRASAGEMLELPYLGEWAEERMVATSGMSRTQFIQSLNAEGVEEAVAATQAAPSRRPLDRGEPAAARPTGGPPLGQTPPTAPPASPEPAAAPTRDWSPRPLERQAVRPIDPSKVRANRPQPPKPQKHQHGANQGPLGQKEANVLRQWLSANEDD